MAEKLIRWLQILYAIQTKPGITVKELADKCETTERTIYRDLRALDVFAPIMNEGYGKGYTFTGNFALYPLNWTEQEALAFSMLPSLLNKSKLPPEFDSAYDKVMAAHLMKKSQDKEIFNRVSEMIQMGSPAYQEESPNFLPQIIQAILSEQSVETTYHTQSRNELTERVIDPYYLVPREQRLYLIGYCHLVREVRTFRLSRFRKVSLLNRSFDKGKFNIKQYLKNTWSIERGEKEIRFKVKFYPEVARYVKEEEMFVRPHMTDLPDGGLLFEVIVNNDREFLRWVMQYGPNAEILEPVSYREQMRKQLKQWIAQYNR